MQAQSQISAVKLQTTHTKHTDRGGGVHTTFYINITEGVQDNRLNTKTNITEGVQDNIDK